MADGRRRSERDATPGRRAPSRGDVRRAGARGDARANGRGDTRAGARGDARHAQADPERRDLRARMRRALLIAAIAGPLAVVLGGALMYLLTDIPTPDEVAATAPAVVVDRNGRQVGRLTAGHDRVDVPLDQIPEDVRNAVLAAEDRRFYEHPGISVAGIARAVIANVTSGRVRQGGSTITQQYAKNAFVGRERTFTRKFKEAVVAVKLDRQWSKDQILEAYLNTIYWGRGAYGIESAARTYFGKRARQLTLHEAALLAGIIRAPETLDPERAPEAALDRRNAVLDAMAGERMVSGDEADRAKARALGARKRRVGGFAPHFLDEVRRSIEARVGPGGAYRGGLKISSTLDIAMQRAAQRAVQSVFDRDSDPDVALVALDAETGEVRAMVGSRSFAKRQLNLATQGRRQAGSAFKPFVLAAALEDGVSLGTRVPAPGTATFRTDDGPWKVSNYDRRGHGSPDLVQATALSLNTVYAKLILDVGPDKVTDIAERAGIRSKLVPVPSLALGTSRVTPMEMTAAFATIAGRGNRADPLLVRKMTHRDGTVVSRWEPKRERVIEEAVADRVTVALQAVVERGTARSAAIGRPVAGKTGTTNDYRDAWFVGYTPQLVTGVWVGFPDGGTMDNVRGRRVTGGSFPAQIWRAFMREAVKDMPVEEFPTPAPEEGDPTGTPSEQTTATPTTAPTSAGPTLPVPIPTSEGPQPTEKTSPSESSSPEPSPTPTSEPSPTPTKTAEAERSP